MSAQSENWRSVAGFDGLYEVSDKGRVRSLPRTVKSKNRWGEVQFNLPGKILAPLTTTHGYLKVLLSKCGSTTNKLISTLVAEAFIGARPVGLLVLHTDGNQKNNTAENLRYGTQKDNMQDSILHGTRPSGKTHYASKLTPDHVASIRSSNATNVQLGKKYGVDPSTIGAVRRKVTWKDI